MLVLQSESAEVAAEVPIDQEQEQEDATSAVDEEKQQVAKGASTLYLLHDILRLLKC